MALQAFVQVCRAIVNPAMKRRPSHPLHHHIPTGHVPAGGVARAAHPGWVQRALAHAPNFADLSCRWIPLVVVAGLGAVAPSAVSPVGGPYGRAPRGVVAPSGVALSGVAPSGAGGGSAGNLGASEGPMSGGGLPSPPLQPGGLQPGVLQPGGVLPGGATPVPEPSTLAIYGLGAAVLLLARRLGRGR